MAEEYIDIIDDTADNEPVDIGNGEFVLVSEGWHDLEEPVVVPELVSIVTNEVFKYTISPIIYLDGTNPTPWAEVGIVQDKEARTLNFSEWNMGSEFSGKIYLRYKKDA
jgi:hypothetical protein